MPCATCEIDLGNLNSPSFSPPPPFLPPQQSVLTAATEKSDNPDLRDRGYIYWRLLSADPDAAKAVILAERPVIADDTSSLESSLLDTLTRNLATLASVYHKPAEAFVRRARATYEDEEEDEEEIDVYGDEEVSGGAGGAAAGGAAPGGSIDLLGMGFGGGSAAPAAAGGMDDFFGSSSAPVQAVSSLPICGEKDGIEIRAALLNKNGVPMLELVAVHKAGNAGPIGACALKLNVNSLGAAPTSAAVNFPSVALGASGAASVPLTFSSAQQSATPVANEVLQAALRDNTSGRVVFFAVPIAAGFSNGFTTFVASAPADKNAFVVSWRALTAEHEASEIARDMPTVESSAVQAKLARANIAFIAARPGPDPAISLSYFSAKWSDGFEFFIEITFKVGLPAVKVVVKSVAGSAAAKVALASVVASIRAFS